MCERRGLLIQSTLQLDRPQKCRMPFNPRRAFNFQVVGIATIILSMAVLAVVLYSAGAMR
jgi:hypothetical protein